MPKENSNKWQHFGKWVEPVLSASFWFEIKFKELDFDFIRDVKSLDNDYFFLKKDLKRAIMFTKNKLTKDKKWFNKLFLVCEEKAKTVLDFKNKTDLNNFLKAMVRCLNCSMVIQLIDHGLEKYLEGLSEKTDISVAEVLPQIKPHKNTPLMKFHEELKTLNKKDVDNFIKKYEWAGTHMFMGTGLTRDKFKKELSKVSGKADVSALKIKFPKIYKEIIDIGSKLAFYRSYLVETVDSVAYRYWPIIKELGEKNGLTWDDMLLLTYQEVIKFNKVKVLPKDYLKRKKGYGVMNINNKIIVITGKEFQEELGEYREKTDTENIREFKGMVAYKGKVRGVVKIIEEARQISKMKKGEILVANGTTPDYVIGMRIAGAIITNHGGLTSHAAIISRELKVPCIIGTKIATKVLRDGDRVEVDANKGIIRKL